MIYQEPLLNVPSNIATSPSIAFQSFPLRTRKVSLLNLLVSCNAETLQSRPKPINKWCIRPFICSLRSLSVRLGSVLGAKMCEFRSLSCHLSLSLRPRAQRRADVAFAQSILSFESLYCPNHKRPSGQLTQDANPYPLIASPVVHQERLHRKQVLT